MACIGRYLFLLRMPTVVYMLCGAMCHVARCAVRRCVCSYLTHESARLLAHNEKAALSQASYEAELLFGGVCQWALVPLLTLSTAQERTAQSSQITLLPVFVHVTPRPRTRRAVRGPGVPHCRNQRRPRCPGETTRATGVQYVCVPVSECARASARAQACLRNGGSGGTQRGRVSVVCVVFGDSQRDQTPCCPCPEGCATCSVGSPCCMCALWRTSSSSEKR